jgi:hypothetical protein
MANPRSRGLVCLAWRLPGSRHYCRAHRSLAIRELMGIDAVAWPGAPGSPRSIGDAPCLIARKGGSVDNARSRWLGRSPGNANRVMYARGQWRFAGPTPRRFRFADRPCRPLWPHVGRGAFRAP